MDTALAALSGKWKLELLYRLREGEVRWAALVHSIPLASPNVLTRQLRELEADGFILRQVSAPKPPQVISYALTPAGQQLRPLLEALADWSREQEVRHDAS